MKEVICINGSGINQDIGPFNVNNEDLRCKMVVRNNKISLRDLIEMIYRVQGNKYDTVDELFFDISTHIDKNGTLFIEADFNGKYY